MFLRPKLKSVLTGCLLTVILVAGCNQYGATVTEEGEVVIGSQVSTDSTYRSVTLAGRPLEILGSNLGVDIVGTDDSTASFVFTRIARGDNASQLRNRLNGVEIRESGESEKFTYTVVSAEDMATRTIVKGRVPRSTVISINVSNGSVRLDGISASQTVTVRNGMIDVATQSPVVSLRTNNGDINVRLGAAPSGARIDAATDNGDVLVAVNPSNRIMLSAQTDVGSVRLQGVEFDSRKLGRTGAGMVFTGEQRAFESRINASTKNGDVTAEVYRMVEAPPQAAPDEMVPDAPGTTMPAADSNAVGSPAGAAVSGRG